jgi:superoxide dismutase
MAMSSASIQAHCAHVTASLPKVALHQFVHNACTPLGNSFPAESFMPNKTRQFASLRGTQTQLFKARANIFGAWFALGLAIGLIAGQCYRLQVKNNEFYAVKALTGLSIPICNIP